MPCGWRAVALWPVPVPRSRHGPVRHWAGCGLCPHSQDRAASREHTREAARGPETVLVALASPLPCSLELEILLLWFVFDFWAALEKTLFSVFGHPWRGGRVSFPRHLTVNEEGESSCKGWLWKTECEGCGCEAPREQVRVALWST